jgi:hypothetical protein
MLVLGAVAGVALAGFALVRGAAEPQASDQQRSRDVVAWVGDEPISRESFARFAAGVNAQRGGGSRDPATQRALLDRLVDEKLLLQEGIPLGLDRREPDARRAIVSAVVDLVTSREGILDPDPATLAAYYARTQGQWARPGPIRIAAARVPLAPAATTAQAAAARAAALDLARRARAGTSLAELAAAAGYAPEPPLPSDLVPPEQLRGRLPETALDAVVRLQPGQVTDPVRDAGGWWVVALLAREPDRAPPLESVASEVRNAWIRDQHEARLRAHLKELRARTPVRIAPGFLAAPSAPSP